MGLVENYKGGREAGGQRECVCGGVDGGLATPAPTIHPFPGIFGL
jgi:hypothetical protein